MVKLTDDEKVERGKLIAVINVLTMKLNALESGQYREVDVRDRKKLTVTVVDETKKSYPEDFQITFSV